MIASVLPISFAEFRLKETARIAVPTFVLNTIHCSSNINAIDTRKMTISRFEMAALPNSRYGA